MTAKTNAERKADERARKRAEGLVQYQIWLKPSQWPRVKKYLHKFRQP